MTPISDLIDPADVINAPLDPQTLTANQQNTIDLQPNGILLRVEGLIEVNHDKDASGATPEEDGIARILGPIDIRDSRGVPYASIHDGRLLQYLSQFTAHRTSVWPSTITVNGGGGATTDRVNFVLDFQRTPTPGGYGSVPAEVGILTEHLTGLNMRVTLGNPANISTVGDLTVNSVTLTLTPHYVLRGTKSYRNLMRYGVMRPWIDSTSKTGVTSGSALQESEPVGNDLILLRSVLIAVDGSNDRGATDADVVSRIAYQNRIRQTPWERDWTDYRRQLQSAYFSEGTTFGNWTNVALLDWEELVGKGGLDRRNTKERDHLLRFTGAGTGSVLILNKGYIPYDPNIIAQNMI